MTGDSSSLYGLFMHSFSRVILVLTAIVTLATTVQAQSMRGRVAVVDFEKLLASYYRTKLANDQLQELSDGINREKARMQVEYDTREKQFREIRDQIIQTGIAETNRVELRRQADENLIEMRRLEDRIKQYGESQKKVWDEQNRRIRANLVEHLQEKVERYGKSYGYLIILDKSQLSEKGIPAVLYRDEGTDITEDLIKEVNR